MAVFNLFKLIEICFPSPFPGGFSELYNIGVFFVDAVPQTQ